MRGKVFICNELNIINCIFYLSSGCGGGLLLDLNAISTYI
jgi:hypothetical protein